MPPKRKKKETTTTSIRRSRPSKKTQEPAPSSQPIGDQAIAEAKVHDPGSTLISNAE